MTYLLDTNVFIWGLSDVTRLGGEIVERLEAPGAVRLVSAVTAWEVAIKAGLGKLTIPEPAATYVPSRIRDLRARPVAIEIAHAAAVEGLPALHRDPFDRLLIAQAQALGATIVTADPQVAQYPVAVLEVGDR